MLTIIFLIRSVDRARAQLLEVAKDYTDNMKAPQCTSTQCTGACGDGTLLPYMPPSKVRPGNSLWLSRVADACPCQFINDAGQNRPGFTGLLTGLNRIARKTVAEGGIKEGRTVGLKAWEMRLMREGVLQPRWGHRQNCCQNFE